MGWAHALQRLGAEDRRLVEPGLPYVCHAVRLVDFFFQLVLAVPAPPEPGKLPSPCGGRRPGLDREDRGRPDVGAAGGRWQRTPGARGTRRALSGGLVIGAALLGVAGPAHGEPLGDTFRRVNPAVVVIRARGSEVEPGGLARFTETGSGVLVSTDGKVMTAAHVVEDVDEVDVEFLRGETVRARVLTSEPAADLSLLQVDRVPPDSKVATLGDSDRVRVGDPVFIVGAPYGLSHSMSAGWISARWPANTVYRPMPLAEFLQTDATINTGNSGGPMFNDAGEVIGIVSHNISKSGGSEGLGFVVTINTARRLLLERPTFWSGLEGQLISGPIAQILNLPQPTGYLVKRVARGSAGDAIGLRGGSVLVTILGEQLVVGATSS